MLPACRPDYQYDTARVRGRVTYNGEPVTRGFVTFFPQSGGERGANPGKRATGEIDENGYYELSTYGDRDGAVVGTHLVTLDVHRGMGARRDVKGVEKPEKGKKAAATRPFPDRYSDTKTSGIEVEVEPGRNEINLELTD